MFTVSYRHQGNYKKISFTEHKSAITFAGATAKDKHNSNVSVKRSNSPCMECRSAYACAYAFDAQTADGNCMMVSANETN